MTDFECPSCGGGFPATAAMDDECPWCGEEMNGTDAGAGPPSPQRLQQPKPADLDELLEEVEPFGVHRRREPVTPHWDSGIRVEPRTVSSAPATDWEVRR